MFKKLIQTSQNLNKTQVLNEKIFYGVKITKPYRKFTDYEFEKFAYKSLVKEYRKKHHNEHWERQTLLENQFIEDFNEQQLKTQANKEMKFRTSICKISIATQKKIKEINEVEQKKQQKLKKYFQEQNVNKMNRRKIVQMLNQESENWYSEENLSKLKDETLIPNFIYDQTDYYLKLHEEALLYSIGDFDGLEELQSENKYIKYKNKLLIPIYQEIVSLIKHMKNSELSKLDKEFEVAQALLNQKYQDYSQVQEKEKMTNLLLKSQKVLRQKLETDLKKNEISVIHEHLLQLYNLLDLWNQYTTIVKMSNAVAEQLIKQEQEKYDIYNTVDKEDTNTFEDSLKSASENETNDSEQEIDLNEDIQTQEQNDQNIKDFVKEASKNEGQEKQIDSFDSILSNLESEKSTEKFEQDFYSKYQEKIKKQQNLEKSDFNLGKGYERQENQNEIYKGIDLENIFSRQLINSVQEYKPTLKYNNLEDIKQYDEGQDILLRNMETKQKKLQTNIICQVYQKRAEQLLSENKDDKKKLHQLQEIQQILNLISEQSIEESRFLLKVWETY